MSRVTRLKYKRRKMRNRIKATSCCLTLALVIGISQGIGTYALFTDSEDIPSDISLSTGDVDVEVSDGKNFTDVQPGEIKSIPFDITNKGTLNQNLSLNLTIPEEIKSYLTYNIVFENISVKEEALYNSNGLLILSPEQKISGSISIKLNEMSIEIQNKLSGIIQQIKLNVTATQINKDNTIFKDGFYDKVIQLSTITFGKANIIPSGSIKVSGNDDTVDIKRETNDSNGYIGLDRMIENYGSVEEIIFIEKSGIGAFSGVTGECKNDTYKLKNVKVGEISEKFGDGNTIRLRFNYKDGSYKIYMLDFRAEGTYGNRKLEVQVSLITTGKNIINDDLEEVTNQEDTELVREETEEVKSDEEGQVKEEIEEVKLDIVEQPNQPESTDPPQKNIQE